MHQVVLEREHAQVPYAGAREERRFGWIYTTVT